MEMDSTLSAFLINLLITLICAKQNSISKNNLVSDFRRFKRPMSEIIIESFNPYQARLAAKEAQEAAESAHSNLVFARKQADINAASAASIGGLSADDYFKSSETGFHEQFLTNQDKAVSQASKAALDAAKEAHAAALASEQQMILAKKQAEFAASSLTNRAKYDKKASEKAYSGKHKILSTKKKNKVKNKIAVTKKPKLAAASSFNTAALETTTRSFNLKISENNNS